ncbi:hypothetical protein KBC55_01935 [Patescibacteria group bacterium]|nr:hypothetical protein [Patescibacteria group bacterium]
MPVSRLLSTALVGTALALVGAGCVTSFSTSYITATDSSTPEISQISNR